MDPPQIESAPLRNELWDLVGGQLALAEFGAPAPCVAGKWEITGVLGRGGYGLVCSARDLQLQRTVAIKLLPQGAEVAGLLREARSLAKLEHPAIVTVFEAAEGEVNCGERALPCGWIVMQLVEGETLGSWLLRARPGPGQIVRVLEAVGRALAHAHERDILHRDLKPQNIMIDKVGRPCVIDFGLALTSSVTAVTDAGGRGRDALGDRLTSTGLVRGTPNYMAPEASGGEPRAASDQFALAVVAWEALTGEHPWRESTSSKASPRRGLPTRWWGRVRLVLERGMATAPAHRFESVAAFCDALATAAAPRWGRRVVGISLGVAALTLGVVLVGRALRSSGEEQASHTGSTGSSCADLEEWNGRWNITSRIVWTEYSNQLDQIRTSGLGLEALDTCQVNVQLEKLVPAARGNPDRLLTETVQATPVRAPNGSWDLAFDISLPGDSTTYGKKKEEQYTFALTLDRSSANAPRLRGAVTKVQTGSKLDLRSAWVLGRRDKIPTLAEVEAVEYPCSARCQVYCAGAEATNSCVARACAPYREPLADPCGPPSSDFVTPLRARAERKHFLTDKPFGLVKAGKPGDCDVNAKRVAGTWWVWRVRESEEPQLLRLDVVPEGCQLRATATVDGEANPRNFAGEITEMGVWFLAPDPKGPLDADTIILAGTGPAFGIDMAEPGRAVRAFRP